MTAITGTAPGACALPPLTLDDIRGRAAIAVPEAAELLGISRSQGYAAARSGDLPTLSFGHRLVVPVNRLLVLLGEVTDDAE